MPQPSTAPESKERAARTIITLPEDYGKKLDKLGKAVGAKLKELKLPGTPPSRSAMVQQMVDDAIDNMNGQDQS